MALETTTSISGLVASNPPDGDPAAQGANHLRLIKNVLKTSFPNLTTPFNASSAKVNNGNVPTGTIVMWSGATLPTGWALCDGGSYPKEDGSGTITVPNLVLKIPRGSSLANVGTQGGADSVVASSVVTVGGTSITQANLPAVNFAVNDPGHGHPLYDPGHRHATAGASNDQNSNLITNGTNFRANAGTYTANSSFSTTGITMGNNYTGITVGSGGSNTAHVHPVTGTIPTLPAFYSLAFIIRL